MNAVTLNEAKQNLERLVAQVIADADSTIICTDAGQQVVLLPLDEFNSWKETLYLLSNPTNAARLLKSISQAQTGRTEEKELVDP